MRQVWLKSNNSKMSNTPFIKVYKKEFIKVGKEMVIVHCDKNFQIVSVEGHPEMAFMKGRPFILEVEAIKSLIEEQQQAARKEEEV